MCKFLLQLTWDRHRQPVAFRVEAMWQSMYVIKTAVTSLVGGVCCMKQEVGRVIDSCLGVVVWCVGGSERELEEASRVLWLNGAADVEAGASKNLKPMLLGFRHHIHGGRHRDDWLNQHFCKHTQTMKFPIKKEKVMSVETSTNFTIQSNRNCWASL